MADVLGSLFQTALTVPADGAEIADDRSLSLRPTRALSKWPRGLVVIGRQDIAILVPIRVAKAEIGGGLARLVTVRVGGGKRCASYLSPVGGVRPRPKVATQRVAKGPGGGTGSVFGG